MTRRCLTFLAKFEDPIVFGELHTTTESGALWHDGGMKIAWLGTGRMGTELALHLLKDHEVTVWNRTAAKAQKLLDAGATPANSPAEAVGGADLVVTCLFGPPQIKEVVLDANLIPEGVPWADATTVSPEDAAQFAEAVPTYVATPVVGSLGPAREGKLGVYVGGSDAQARDLVAKVVAPWAAANPERLKVVDSAAKAATGKLLANLALAVSAQGVLEALHLAASNGVDTPEALEMLDSTGLAFLKNMKAPFVLGERDTEPGDFSVNAIAKDVGLMLRSAQTVLPATAAALESLEMQQDEGRGEHDFSAILVNRNQIDQG
ncbi:3-hydroxyisobutyrate dehydrogenase [Corynebacterium gerontici]|uniref:3-hydroxyisobutyrate dehydrogenase n=2 Tax=Corynebacterium gerontici TaxID=2079234 RepID=A0A3G6J2P1_9CORY|nr:3-hydroxyisobutyrate dehydrogenase [Corynebacterium gerontici]